MRLRFSIRDVLWVMVVAAVISIWHRDRATISLQMRVDQQKLAHRDESVKSAVRQRAAEFQQRMAESQQRMTELEEIQRRWSQRVTPKMIEAQPQEYEREQQTERPMRRDVPGRGDV